MYLKLISRLSFSSFIHFPKVFLCFSLEQTFHSDRQMDGSQFPEVGHVLNRPTGRSAHRRTTAALRTLPLAGLRALFGMLSTRRFPSGALQPLATGHSWVLPGGWSERIMPIQISGGKRYKDKF